MISRTWLYRRLPAVFAGLALLFPLLPQNLRGVPILPTINTNNIITITDPPYNAIGDGATDNTLAISNAIVQASKGGSTNGLLGGTVRIPSPGTFLSGPLFFKNNVNVQIDSGATLKMLPLNLWTNYPPQNQVYGNLFYASGNTNLEISGSGTIDGQGAAWWSASSTVFNNRPYMIFFNGNCGRILVRDVTIQNPPKMHVVFKGTDNDITIQGITINTTAGNAANTDGIDLVGTHCLVKDCTINAGDDNIALGSSSASAISTDILVTNCAFGQGHGVSIGSNTAGAVSNLTVINCTFNGTQYGIRMKSNDATSGGSGEGGIARNLNYYNIGMTNIVNGAVVIYSYYGSGGQNGTPTSVSPLFAATQTVDTTSIPVWRDVTISNVTATVSSGGVCGIIWARMEVPATNIVFKHVNISGGKPFDVYSARQVQFIDCQITPRAGSNTFLTYNADLTISNSTLSTNLLTFDGLCTNGYGSSLALYNASGALANTNTFDTGPLTLGGSTLIVSNNLDIGASKTINFALGTNSSTLIVKSNLSLSGTVNLTAGPGFSNTSYTLFAYSNNLTWGPPTEAGSPGGFSYALDNSVPGVVNAVTGSLLVLNTNDTGPGSLRQQVANAAPGFTILFTNGLAGIITLTSGPITLGKSLNLLGPGPGNLALKGSSNRVFTIASGPLLISGLCITNGFGAGAVDGGGIKISTTFPVAFSNCWIVGNSCVAHGGALINAGPLTMWNSIISNNVCSGLGQGGAIYNVGGGTSVFWNCTISGNVAVNDQSPFGGALGGALYSLGGASIFRNCTFCNNTVNGPSGNATGGAIYRALGTVLLTNCSIAYNQAIGSGTKTGGGAAGTNISLAGCIIAQNTADIGPDVNGAFISGGYNLIGKGDSSAGLTNGVQNDQVGSIASPLDPLLGNLQDNGGPTPTIYLLPGSPAIDQGNSFGLATDQRGAPRPFDYSGVPNASGGDGSDIGAFESATPTIQLQEFPTYVLLSWPLYYSGFTMQSSPDLSSSNWIPLPDAPIASGSQWVMSNNIAGPSVYYRLKGN